MLSSIPVRRSKHMKISSLRPLKVVPRFPRLLSTVNRKNTPIFRLAAQAALVLSAAAWRMARA